MPDMNKLTQLPKPKPYEEGDDIVLPGRQAPRNLPPAPSPLAGQLARSDALRPARVVPVDPVTQAQAARAAAEQALEAERRAQRAALVELCQRLGDVVAGYELLSLDQLRHKALQASARAAAKLETLAGDLEKSKRRK